MSASTTRPVQHSAPLLLSIFARPHQNGLIRCWRADSLGLCLARDPGITPCCKSRKLPGDNFPAITRTNRRPPLCVASITLPRSPVSLSSGDEVPHIFTRKSRLQSGEFLISSAKRLLQQYLPGADIATMRHQIYLNTSTVANGSADHGRKRFNVNFVFCPGWTSTSR